MTLCPHALGRDRNRGDSPAINRLCPHALSRDRNRGDSPAINRLSHGTVVVWRIKMWNHFSIQWSPIAESALLFWSFLSFAALVILVRATCRRSWVWSVGGMTGRVENRSARTKTCPSVTLSTTNIRRPGVRSHKVLPGETAWAMAGTRGLQLIYIIHKDTPQGTYCGSIIKISWLMLYMGIIAV